MRLTYAIISLSILALCLASGCRPAASATGPRADALDPAVRDAIEAVADVDRASILRLSDQAERTPAFLESLKAIHWESVPPGPNPPSNLQGARHAGIVLYLTSDHRELVRDLFEDFDAGTIDEGTLVDATRLLDAVLAGLLRSHPDLNNRSIDNPNSILTYAALLRAGMSRYFHDRGLGHLTPLTPAQRDRLGEMPRHRDFSGMDELP